MIRAEEQATNGAAVIALDENQTVTIDLPTLIETRAIIQANSGGGKSWAIRRILEQSHGKVQQIIIDVEGSFRTLREQFEYILLGALSDDVDYPITPTNAPLLATTLLEARTSVILDLYEFRPTERQQIVRHFLDALMNAPKPLWHDCLIVLDEAHIFCPEQTAAEAKEAVEALCSRGRARGFCALLATQRISKLDKDAVAECNNKLIGRTSLDLDRKRSNIELELPTKSRDLTTLAPGEFFVFGPAISPTVQKITIGPVLTTHPKAGSHRLMSSPPPPESLRAVLEMLQALPVPTVQVPTLPEERSPASSPASGRRQPQTIRQRQTRSSDTRKPSRGHPIALEPSDAELEALRERVATLEAQMALLKTINVSVNGSLVPASDLPAVLHLDTLHTQVEQATITVASMGAETVPPVKLVQRESQTPAVPESRVSTPPVLTQDTLELLYSEKKLLARLVAQVKALSLSEKALFVWLIEHDGQKVSSRQLADAVGMDRRVTWANQTKHLVKLPFIARWGAHQFWYRAQLGDYCRRYFSSPAAEQAITSALIRAAQ
jgi:hypothetical protein